MASAPPPLADQPYTPPPVPPVRPVEQVDRIEPARCPTCETFVRGFDVSQGVIATIPYAGPGGHDAHVVVPPGAPVPEGASEIRPGKGLTEVRVTPCNHVLPVGTDLRIVKQVIWPSLEHVPFHLLAEEIARRNG